LCIKEGETDNKMLVLAQKCEDLDMKIFELGANFEPDQSPNTALSYHQVGF
jgi:hypothetical protein